MAEEKKGEKEMESKIYELLEKWENTSNDSQEVEEQINDYFKSMNMQCIIHSEQMFESPGYDLYVMFVSWIDENNNLQGYTAKREYC